MRPANNTRVRARIHITVYAIAHALEALRQSNQALDSGAALRDALRNVTFQGIYSRVAFNALLEPRRLGLSCPTLTPLT